MKILALHTSHHGSITYVVDNEVIFHTQLDRYNRIKNTPFVSLKILKLIESLSFDLLIFTGLLDNNCFESYYDLMLNHNLKIREKLQNAKVVVDFNNHHIFHAYCSLCWNKDYENILVMDGDGSVLPNNLTEQESIYVYKNELTHIKTSHLQIGEKYQKGAFDIFKENFKEGKLLALSLYNKKANKIQQDFEKNFDTYLINNNLEGSIIFTGGTAQNVKNNSLHINKFKNIFPDPFNGDFGISLGSINYHLQNKIKINNVYLGIPQKLNLDLFYDHIIKEVTVEEVAKILINDPVAIFQSRSEQGQRGLGNRSLLMNANHVDAINKLNTIKKREWYRPFACTILYEEAHKWFDMKIDESPFMMFLFNVYPSKRHFFKAGIAKDNSCRIQTLKKSYNKHFYDLLKYFDKITGFPFLINTSLNLPGQVLVEEMEDLKEMFYKTDLSYIYFPEINKLIKKQ